MGETNKVKNELTALMYEQGWGYRHNTVTNTAIWIMKVLPPKNPSAMYLPFKFKGYDVNIWDIKDG